MPRQPSRPCNNSTLTKHNHHDVLAVRALAKHVVGGTSTTGHARIAHMQEKRKTRHEAAIQVYRSVVASADLCLEESLAQATTSLRKGHDGCTDDIREWFDAVEKNPNLSQVEAERRWSGIEDVFARRKQLVERFQESLESMESIWSESVHQGLQILGNAMMDICHVLPHEARALIEEERSKANTEVLERRKAYTDMLIRLEMMACTQEHEARQQWEGCLNNWRHAKHNYALNSFVELANSKEHTDPFWRREIITTMHTTLTRGAEVIFNELDGLKTLLPPTLTTKAVQDVEQHVQGCLHKMEEKTNDLLEQLVREEEARNSRLQASLESLCHELSSLAVVSTTEWEATISERCTPLVSVRAQEGRESITFCRHWLSRYQDAVKALTHDIFEGVFAAAELADRHENRLLALNKAHEESLEAERTKQLEQEKEVECQIEASLEEMRRCADREQLEEGYCIVMDRLAMVETSLRNMQAQSVALLRANPGEVRKELNAEKVELLAFLALCEDRPTRKQQYDSERGATIHYHLIEKDGISVIQTSRGTKMYIDGVPHEWEEEVVVQPPLEESEVKIPKKILKKPEGSVGKTKKAGGPKDKGKVVAGKGAKKAVCPPGELSRHASVEMLSGGVDAERKEGPKVRFITPRDTPRSQTEETFTGEKEEDGAAIVDANSQEKGQDGTIKSAPLWSFVEQMDEHADARIVWDHVAKGDPPSPFTELPAMPLQLRRELRTIFRKAFFEDQEGRRKLQVTAAEVAAHRIEEEISDEVGRKLRLHAPRAGIVEADVYQARVFELAAHRQCYDRHVRALIDKIQQQKHILEESLGKEEQILAVHLNHQRQRITAMGSLTTLKSLDSLTNDVHIASAAFLESVETRFARHKELAHTLSGQLRHSNTVFLESIRQRTDGIQKGEMKRYERDVAVLEDAISDFVSQTTEKVRVMINQQRTAAKDIVKNYERDLCLHDEDIQFLEDMGMCQGTQNNRIRSECAHSDTQQEHIAELITRLVRVCEEDRSHENSSDPASILSSFGDLHESLISRRRYTEARITSQLLEVSGGAVSRKILDNKILDMRSCDPPLLDVAVRASSPPPPPTTHARRKSVSVTAGGGGGGGGGPRRHSAQRADEGEQTFLTVVESILRDSRESLRALCSEFYKNKGDRKITRPNRIPPTLRHCETTLEEGLASSLAQAQAFLHQSQKVFRQQVASAAAVLYNLPAVVFVSLSRGARSLVEVSQSQHRNEFSTTWSALEKERERNRGCLHPLLSHPNHRAELCDLQDAERKRAERAKHTLCAYRDEVVRDENDYASRFLRGVLYATEYLLGLYDTIVLPEQLSGSNEEVIVNNNRKRKSLRRRMQQWVKDKEERENKTTADSSSCAAVPSDATGDATDRRQWKGLPLIELRHGDETRQEDTPKVTTLRPETADTTLPTIRISEAKATSRTTPATTSNAPPRRERRREKSGGAAHVVEQQHRKASQEHIIPPPVEEREPLQKPEVSSSLTSRDTTYHLAIIEARDKAYAHYRSTFRHAINKILGHADQMMTGLDRWEGTWAKVVQQMKDEDRW